MDQFLFKSPDGSIVLRFVSTITVYNLDQKGDIVQDNIKGATVNKTNQFGVNPASFYLQVRLLSRGAERSVYLSQCRQRSRVAENPINGKRDRHSRSSKHILVILLCFKKTLYDTFSLDDFVNLL